MCLNLVAKIKNNFPKQSAKPALADTRPGNILALLIKQREEAKDQDDDEPTLATVMTEDNQENVYVGAVKNFVDPEEGQMTQRRGDKAGTFFIIEN